MCQRDDNPTKEWKNKWSPPMGQWENPALGGGL